MTSQNFDPAARRRARRILVQMLYQWGLTQDGLSSLQHQFEQEVAIKEADEDYFLRVLEPLFKEMENIDALIAQEVDSSVHSVSLVEQSVLRLAVFELVHCPDIPAAVVLNEALDLNKRFGAPEGHRFVNGVLDSLLASLRPYEKKH